MRVLITGAAGYVGCLLIDHFLARGDVDAIIGLDRKSCPISYAQEKRLTWICANTRSEDWQKIAANTRTDVVIHAAWHIREPYFFRKKYEKDNIEGSNRVFDFAFSSVFVRTFIHISTVAVYGAWKDSEGRPPYAESDSLRESEYWYAKQKIQSEKNLEKKYKQYQENSSSLPAHTIIVRPVSLTGPRYLASKSKKISLQALLKSVLPILPITSSFWGRQFLHEEDFCGSIDALIARNDTRGLATFNLTSDAGMSGTEIAHETHKKILTVRPIFIRILFFLLWHVTFGMIPTSKGGWRFFCYPLIVDGSKFCKTYGYQYRYSSKEAFLCHA